MDTEPTQPSTSAAPAAMPSGRRNPWLVFLGPMVVYMVLGMLAPAHPSADRPQEPAPNGVGLVIEYRYYPLVYSLQLAATLAMLIYAAPGYRQFPFRVSGLAALVGVVGAAVWIGLAFAQREIAERLGWSLALGERSAFNPLEQLGRESPLAYAFLALRLAGLVVIVPLIEEFFLRGFVIRFPIAADWWRAPIGDPSPLAVGAAIVIPVLYHPEALAAVAWFAMMAWLVVRTRNIWDCVMAHALTNLLLGIFVLISGNWWLM